MVDKSRSSARLSQEFPVKPLKYPSELNRGEGDDSKKSSLEIGRLQRASSMTRKSSRGKKVSTDSQSSWGNQRAGHPYFSANLETMDGVFPKPTGELSTS